MFGRRPSPRSHDVFVIVLFDESKRVAGGNVWVSR